MGKALRVAFFLLLYASCFGQRILPQVMQAPPVTGGTFTLRYATPANCVASSASTTCAPSLSGKTISAGDLLIYQCATEIATYIASVSNTGTYVPDYAGFAGQQSGRQMSQGYILAAAAESGTATITFNASSNYSNCIIWDYSYTGSPAYDGGNSIELASASATSIVEPSFTPSSGSNNDIYVEGEMGTWSAATAVSSPFTLVAIGDSGFAYDNNTTTAYGPTFTLPTIGYPVASQMEFGYNVTAPAKWMWNNMSGTNAATVTAATLAAGTSGIQHQWYKSGSGTFTYATAASQPLTGSLARLSDGSAPSDSSTTGISLATGTGSGGTNWRWGHSSALIGADVVTAGITASSDLPANDSTSVDHLAIEGLNNGDYANAMLRGDGTHRFINLECGSGQNTSQSYQTTVGNSYHTELIYNPAVGTVNTSGTAVTWVSGPKFSSKLMYGTAQFYIGAGHTAYTIASVDSPTAITLTTSAGTQTGAAYNSAHYLKVYTGWASPSSPGSLASTQVCYSTGVMPSSVTFGNNNANTLTTGHYVYFDSMLASVDGADPL